jgi:hypothetical protein
MFVPSQPEQIVRKTLSQKWAGGVAQGVGPEFKSQYNTKEMEGGREEGGCERQSEKVWQTVYCHHL